MRLFYRLFVWFYPKIAWLLGFYNQKARLWIRGRRGAFKKLSEALHPGPRPVIWMHCSSLGEFEQGRPILESIRNTYPRYRIVLSFFSPSGYEVRKNYTGADHICYLPMDTPGHANRWLNIVQPDLVIFIKYEFWFYYLDEVKQRDIPLLLVSGIFRKDQPFFKWYGGFHRRMLGCFTQRFVQNTASYELLAGIGFADNTGIGGDTRFDRVITIAAAFEPMPVVEHFCAHYPVVVAGSTWTDDDEALDHFANTHPEIKFIVAPHDIEAGRIQECLTLYKHAVLYSVYEEALRLGKTLNTDYNVLVIDNMGMLSRLYHYASVCYIGGGFGDDGIHNVLEAAVYGKPVVFGPVYDRYFEAVEMVDAGAAFSIEDALELEACIKELLEDKALYGNTAGAAYHYVQANAGATGRIMRYIQEKRLLTN